MADLVKAAATAKRLVEANGRSVELFKLNRTADDPTKPWRGSSDAPAAISGGDTQTVLMAFVPPSGTGFGRTAKDAGGSLVVNFDQVGLVASDSLPAGVDLKEFDTVRDGTDIWKIVAREELKPASNSILFSLGLKK